MRDSKMMLEAELDRPHLPVFDAPALAPDIHELAPAARGTAALADLSDVPVAAWSRLADNAIEPNAFYQPDWARAVSAHARGRTGAKALLAWDNAEPKNLIGVLPVVSAWRALKLPIPVWVAWQAYAPLSTPLLDRDAVNRAAGGLIDAARASGAAAIFFPDLAPDGPAAAAITDALARRNIRPHHHATYERARLDTRTDAAVLLRNALGAKKLKELRRQRNRLADLGPVEFQVARAPADVAAALEVFLRLEAAGWKGQRGTALVQHDGDHRFIHEAAATLTAQGAFEIATLSHGGEPVACGLVLRHQRRAYFFKIAIDETEARTSPGVQLTLDLTRQYCDDTGIDDVDSTADADHPMINHVWRDRQPLCHLFAPTQPNNYVTDLLSGTIAARAVFRMQARKLVHRFRKVRETSS